MLEEERIKEKIRRRDTPHIVNPSIVTFNEKMYLQDKLVETLTSPLEDSLRGNQLFDQLLKECDEYIHCKPDFGVENKSNPNMDSKLIEQLAELVSQKLHKDPSPYAD